MLRGRVLQVVLTIPSVLGWSLARISASYRLLLSLGIRIGLVSPMRSLVHCPVGTWEHEVSTVAFL